MQYTALVLAALSAAAALPGARKANHHHHRRHAEAEADANLDNVDWAQALAGINWDTVVYDKTTPQAAQATPVGTTTVAVVAATAQTTLATTTSASALVTAGNVAKAQVAVTTSSSSAIAAAVTSAASASSSTSMTASDSEYTIEVVNNCAYTIWQAGWQTNTAGSLIDSQVKGNEMSAGSSISLAIPKAALGVQLWARTGCTGSGSSFTCTVGDCQGFECTSIIWQDGPIMAEFGSGLNTDIYNTDITAYDISAIPGNNVGAKIVPSKSSCETKYCPVTGCTMDQAWLSADDMYSGSPADTTCSNDTNFVVTFCPA